MKKSKLIHLIIVLTLTVFAFSAVKAQDENAPNEQNPNFRRRNRPVRMLQELGLAREQIQQIRRINQDRRPVMQLAQRNWREAQIALDQAIYADDSTEEEIQQRVREAQSAHNEFLKARAATEYLIRRVLTPEQLQKFRRLRERFNQRMNDTDPDRPPLERDVKNEPPRPAQRLQQPRSPNRPR
jgi:Spy/CpxP family protein refolding chaperone